jgi:hypothetical protein
VELFPGSKYVHLTREPPKTAESGGRQLRPYASQGAKRIKSSKSRQKNILEIGKSTIFKVAGGKTKGFMQTFFFKEKN